MKQYVVNKYRFLNQVIERHEDYWFIYWKVGEMMFPNFVEAKYYIFMQQDENESYRNELAARNQKMKFHKRLFLNTKREYLNYEHSIKELVADKPYEEI